IDYKKCNAAAQAAASIECCLVSVAENNRKSINNFSRHAKRLRREQSAALPAIDPQASDSAYDCGRSFRRGFLLDRQSTNQPRATSLHQCAAYPPLLCFATLRLCGRLLLLFLLPREALSNLAFPCSSAA